MNEPTEEERNRLVMDRHRATQAVPAPTAQILNPMTGKMWPELPAPTVSAEACYVTRELRAENGRRLLANPREEFLTEEEIAAIIQHAIDTAVAPWKLSHEEACKEITRVQAKLALLHESHDALAKECETWREASSDWAAIGIEIIKLRDEAKELRNDKARLDWLDCVRPGIEAKWSNDGNQLQWRIAARDYATIRPAIDAAMTAQNGRPQ